MNAPALPAETLRAALAGLLDGLPPRQASQAVERLIASYRGATPTDAPILRDRADVAAYAAYRMPATFEAVRSALEAFAEAVPEWAPGAHLDVGGGTGAAAWAASATWDGERPVTVLDWAEPALALGREIAAANPALRDVRWQRSRIGAALTLESTDLVTVSYVLNELTAPDRTALVDAAAAAARAVVIVEPGTPDGYARVIEARDRLIAAGFHIAAPCPHSAACPIVARHRLVPLLGPGQPFLPAPPGQGRLPRLRGREVQLRRRRPLPRRTGRRTRRPQAPDPQGPGAPRPLRDRTLPEPHHRHQAPRRPVQGRTGRGLGGRLAALLSFCQVRIRSPRALGREQRVPQLTGEDL